MCKSSHGFQFTYGVNAWKHWVVQKNAELEKLRAQGKYMKTFETDILKLRYEMSSIERLRECRRLKLRRFACRADELNFTLCMFVKEVKKPNGDPYAPDSIFYLTLGIQVYSHQSVVGDPSGRQQGWADQFDLQGDAGGLAVD